MSSVISIILHITSLDIRRNNLKFIAKLVFLDMNGPVEVVGY